MCRKHALWALVALTLAAAFGCSGGSSSSSGSSSDSSSSSGGTGTAVLIQALSGTPRSLDGTWTKCGKTNGGTKDEKTTFVSSGNAATITVDDYALSSGCTGAVTAHVLTISYTGSFTGTKSAVWTDGNGNIVSGPARADGTGTLPSPVTVSAIAVTVTASDLAAYAVGATFDGLNYIDDSATAWRRYEDKFDETLAGCVDGTPVGKCMGNFDPDIKQ